MTKGKDFKQLVRARCAKTGESYVEAQRQLLSKGVEQIPSKGGLDGAVSNCSECGCALASRKVMEIDEPDEDATEGQMADHQAAVASGEWGEWAYESEESYCPTCEDLERDRVFTEGDKARAKARVVSAKNLPAQPTAEDLVEWFVHNYEDPVNGVPHDSGEGGYQYILGGPEDAEEVLREYFEPQVPDTVIEEAVAQILPEGWEWVERNLY